MHLPRWVGDEMNAWKDYATQMAHWGMEKAEELVETLLAIGTPIAIVALVIAMSIKYWLDQRNESVQQSTK
jgi:DNA-directed RNA polymerase subunit F